MSTRVLLLSSSRVHGCGILDHAEAALREFLGPDVREVVFVPFALADHDRYTQTMRERLAGMGYETTGLHTSSDPATTLMTAQAVFVGGGNTFRLVTEVYRRGLMGPLQSRVGAGMPYIGSSAGTNLAGLTVGSTNDMPIVYPPSFVALGLVPFNLNPHYVEPDPTSTHQGETRDDRLREFHEENTQPVLALREPAMLRRDGARLRLLGTAGARLFRRGRPTSDLLAGSDVSSLLATEISPWPETLV